MNHNGKTCACEPFVVVFRQGYNPEPENGTGGEYRCDTASEIWLRFSADSLGFEYSLEWEQSIERCRYYIGERVIIAKKKITDTSFGNVGNYPYLCRKLRSNMNTPKNDTLKEELTTEMHSELMVDEMSPEELRTWGVYGAMNRGFSKSEACNRYGLSIEEWERRFEDIQRRDKIIEDYRKEQGFDICVLFAKSSEGNIYRLCSAFAFSHPHAKTGIPILVLFNGNSVRELDHLEVRSVLSQLNG